MLLALAMKKCRREASGLYRFIPSPIPVLLIAFHVRAIGVAMVSTSPSIEYIAGMALIGSVAVLLIFYVLPAKTQCKLVGNWQYSCSLHLPIFFVGVQLFL